MMIITRNRRYMCYMQRQCPDPGPSLLRGLLMRYEAGIAPLAKRAWDTCVYIIITHRERPRTRAGTGAGARARAQAMGIGLERGMGPSTSTGLVPARRI